jgi:hypothetical protein
MSCGFLPTSGIVATTVFVDGSMIDTDPAM